jgi:hypothetical protein
MKSLILLLALALPGAAFAAAEVTEVLLEDNGRIYCELMTRAAEDPEVSLQPSYLKVKKLEALYCTGPNEILRYQMPKSPEDKDLYDRVVLHFDVMSYMVEDLIAAYDASGIGGSNLAFLLKERVYDDMLLVTDRFNGDYAKHLQEKGVVRNETRFFTYRGIIRDEARAWYEAEKTKK